MHLGWSGAEVGFARAQDHAWEIELVARPHLVIIEAAGPVIDWLSTIRHARDNSDSVIFAISEHHDESEFIEAVEAGADDYMALPLNLPLFVARARAALRRVRGEWPQPPVVFAGLHIDPERYEASLEGVELALTTTEFRLLLELTRKNDSVVRKGSLCRSLWGNDGGSEDAILRKHIQNLRRKLDSPVPAVNIVTVPGVGYKLTSSGHRAA